MRCAGLVISVVGLAACSPGSKNDSVGDTTPATDGAGATEDRPPSASEYDFDAFDAMCEAQPDREACESVETVVGSDFAAGCIWQVWTSPTIEPDGTCSFSETDASCTAIVSGSEGCPDLSYQCDAGRPHGGFRTMDGVVQIGFGQWCSVPPGWCGPSEGPPECACLCDPAWPDE